MTDDWINTTDDLPKDDVRVKINTPQIAYIGKDGFWHDSVSGEKIPSHLITSWAPLF